MHCFAQWTKADKSLLAYPGSLKAACLETGAVKFPSNSQIKKEARLVEHVALGRKRLCQKVRNDNLKSKSRVI